MKLPKQVQPTFYSIQSRTEPSVSIHLIPWTIGKRYKLGEGIEGTLSPILSDFLLFLDRSRMIGPGQPSFPVSFVQPLWRNCSFEGTDLPCPSNPGPRLFIYFFIYLFLLFVLESKLFIFYLS